MLNVLFTKRDILFEQRWPSPSPSLCLSNLQPISACSIQMTWLVVLSWRRVLLSNSFWLALWGETWDENVSKKLAWEDLSVCSWGEVFISLDISKVDKNWFQTSGHPVKFGLFTHIGHHFPFIFIVSLEELFYCCVCAQEVIEIQRLCPAEEEPESKSL